MSPRLAVVPELDTELDDLFARPLSEFTAARNELARRLRNAGQEDAAAGVQALKKPSVPVWTVNQLARSRSELVVQTAMQVQHHALLLPLAGGLGDRLSEESP